MTLYDAHWGVRLSYMKIRISRRNIEKELENALACLSGAWMGSNHVKKWRSKISWHTSFNNFIRKPQVLAVEGHWLSLYVQWERVHEWFAVVLVVFPFPVNASCLHDSAAGIQLLEVFHLNNSSKVKRKKKKHSLTDKDNFWRGGN